MFYEISIRNFFDLLVSKYLNAKSLLLLPYLLVVLISWSLMLPNSTWGIKCCYVGQRFLRPRDLFDLGLNLRQRPALLSQSRTSRPTTSRSRPRPSTSRPRPGRTSRDRNSHMSDEYDIFYELNFQDPSKCIFERTFKKNI